MVSRRLDDPSALKSTAMNPFGSIWQWHYPIGHNLSRIQLVVGIELQWLSGKYTIGVDDVVVEFCCHLQCLACVLKLHFIFCCNSPNFVVSLPNAISI
jgi:hypothetical protein